MLTVLRKNNPPRRGMGWNMQTKIDKAKVIEELACALDLAKFHLKNPDIVRDGTLYDMIDDALGYCEEVQN